MRYSGVFCCAKIKKSKYLYCSAIYRLYSLYQYEDNKDGPISSEYSSLKTSGRTIVS